MLISPPKYREYDHEYFAKKILTTLIFFHEKKHHLRPYKVSRKTILLGEENYPSFLKRGTMSENASFVIAQIPSSPF